MIKCIAIDDEPLALKQLTTYIERIPFLELVGAFDNALNATAFLAENSVDLIYVDINMPDLSGIDFVSSLIVRKYMVVFTTAYSEYALESYKLDAMDYLLKPIAFNDFLRSANKSQQFQELINASKKSDTEQHTNMTEAEDSDSNKEYLSVKADYKVSLVKISDICFLESEGEYVRIHMESGEIITTLIRLKNMETALPTDSFMRIHRSYIVNLKRIKEMSQGRSFCADKTGIHICSNYVLVVQSDNELGEQQ